MTSAYINRIATAVPPNNVHAGFVRLAETLLPEDRGKRTVFRRMAERSGIERRYSFLTPASENDTQELELDCLLCPRPVPEHGGTHAAVCRQGPRACGGSR